MPRVVACDNNLPMRFLLLAATIPCLAAGPPSVDSLATKCQASVSYYAKNLETRAAFGLREDERVRTASTIKLPIMAGVFAAVDAGRGKLTDELIVTKEDKVGGSGVLGGFSDGAKLRLQDLILLMIVLSDNTATNMILEKYPADLINSYAADLGLRNTKVLRKILKGEIAAGYAKEGKMEEFRPFGFGVSTPKEMVLLLEKLERGEVVSAERSKAMIEILKQQQDNAGLQRRTTFPVASKAGALDKLRSDVGIIYAPWGRIAMAITVDDIPPGGYKPDHPGLLCIADISKAIVDYWKPNAK